MWKRIAAIVFIYFCTSVAWAILGSTIFVRSKAFDSQLRDRIVSMWGAPQEQARPTAAWCQIRPIQTLANEDGKQITQVVDKMTWNPMPLESSRVTAGLHLDYRQKGLLWYSTYRVAFAGKYLFRNPSDQPRGVTFTLRLPAEQATYDDLNLSVDGKPLPVKSDHNGTYVVATVAPRALALFEASYRSQGLESWRYNFGDQISQVRDFQLHVNTDFSGFDFPENTLSPSEKQRTPDGWELAWDYKNLVSGYNIGIDLPKKLQPGPLAGRISYFAPVSLLFFLFVLFVLTTVRGIELHPISYFFLACTFFAFHLLMAYLVDHVSIHVAFIICSAVSIFLLVSYLRLVAGRRFAAEAGVAQLIYLVLFSYAFFFEGFTGLAITVGAIITLFVVMQITGRIRWAEKFASQPISR
jgi:Inner membrane protein CreD